jgi:hypothetical protein
MPSRPTAPRFRVEPLEDRVTPAVTAALNGGTLTVTLGAANDTATVTGTTAGGTDLQVAGTGFTTQTFNGVTALVVVDGGANAGQAVTFDDAGAGTGIQLAGAVTVNGVETVSVATANGALRAQSFGVVNAATAVNLAAGVTTTGTAGQLYGGPVTVGSGTVTAVTLDAGAAGGVQFTQAVNGFANDANSLTVNAGSATAPTRFDGAVGATLRLANLTTDAAGTTRIAGNVSTGANQVFGDAVTVAATAALFFSNGGRVEFGGTLNALTAGSQAVVVNTSGVTRFGGAVGGTAALQSVTTDAVGTTELAAGVTTTGSQTYGDPVTVSGAEVKLASTASGAVAFGGAVTAAAAGTTALSVNTGGTTTFAGNVGTAAVPLLSLTTDPLPPPVTGSPPPVPAGGVTVIGPGANPVAVYATGAITFNDSVRLSATTATVESTAGGAVTFGGTLDGSLAGTTVLTVNASGITTFAKAVGGTTTLAGLTTNAAGTTVLGAPVTTTGAQTYGDPVTVTPSQGVNAVTVSASTGPVTFGGTITGASAIPFTARAGGTLTLGGNVTLSAVGSSFTAHSGAGGTGSIVFPAGVVIRADSQTYRAGDGAGLLTTAAVDLLTNAPQLRNAAGTAAPVAFALRQDESLTDATLPAAAQFGGSFPRSIALVSDDGALTLNSTTIAGAQTTDLLLSAAQTLTLGAAVNAPTATVRLRSSAGAVVQTAAGGVTAAALGVQAATGVDLTAAANTVPLFAARSAAGAVKYATNSPVTVGVIAADPLTGLFPATTGVVTAGGDVALTPFGATALDLTVSAPLTATGGAVTVTGGAGADRVVVNYNLGATLTTGLTFTGGAGADTLVLNDLSDASTAHTYFVNQTAPGAVVRDGGAAVTLPGVEALSIIAGNLADTFNVTPSADYTISIAGNGPTTGTSDTLALDLTAATGRSLSATRSATGLAGTGTFTNRQQVSFSGIETLTPAADVRVTATASLDLSGGGTGTITVTVTNTGPTAVTDVPLTNLIPAGLTATWTATGAGGATADATSGSGDINTTADLPVSGSVTFTIRLTASGTARGVLTNTFTAGSSPAVFELDAANNSASTTVTAAATDLVAVGAGPGGGPVVAAYNPDGTERFRRFAFDAAYSGGVTVATGDVNGDGFEDLVAGSASGASRVTVFDGRTGNQVASFFAFPGFSGGVNVAVAGGRIVAGAGAGGAPVVAVFTLTAGGPREDARFFAFDSSFRGGVQVGGSDGLLAAGAGAGGGPHVKLFNATTLAQTASFFAFPLGSTDGVSVAIGGTAAAPTVLVGSGLGSNPVAVTFNATTLAQIDSFQAFESSFRGGVRVANGGVVSNQQTTVVAPGPGGSTRVRFLAPDRSAVRDFFAFESAFSGGVYVG